MRGGRKNPRNAGPKGTGPQVFKINSILSASFSNLGLNARIKEYQVKKLWPEAVGKSIAQKASPIRLMGQTLYCAVVSSAWMTELNYQKISVIERLNGKLGQDAVKDIVFRIGQVHNLSRGKVSTGPVRELTHEERSLIDKTAEAIEDSSLKDIVKRVMEKSKTYEEGKK